MSIKEDRSVDPCPDYRAVVAVDFGTTYSGFAYTHLNNSSLEAKVYDSYPGQNMAPKTNTVLQYKNGFTIVDRWGYHALAKEPRRKRSTATTLEEHPVELFKLHLSTDPRAIEKAILPPGLPYRKAITDYLMQLQKLVKETLASKWAEISFSQVKFVFSVPAEWEPHTKGVLRECIHAAGFLSRRFAENLEFIAEPEAAAIFCLDIVTEHKIEIGDSFMVCDCGGGTVDLTTRTLLVGDQLGEITERTGGLCGGTYVDQQFEIFLARLVGEDAMVKFKTKHYGQYQHMILNFFCRQIKFHFCGDPSKFSPIEFDIELSCPDLKSYMSETVVKEMDAQDWLIEISFENIKSMFDPVVGMILGLVQNQLTAAAKPVKAIFIVGGFGENPYLLAEMKRVFGDKVSTITVPVNAQAAIMKGALKYGVNQKVIFNRRLTYTYGVEISPKWKTGDPEDRKTEDGRIHKFDRLATRGVSASISDEFGSTYYPVYPWQKNILFRVFATKENGGRYTDEPGMMLIGKLHIELPDIEHGLDRPVKFGLRFAEEEIKVSAVNTMNGKKYEATFKYDF